MTTNDRWRQDRLREHMAAAGIDALVCRLPENVMYMTDYWPHHGFSVVVFPKDGEPLLYAPEVEEPYAKDAWAEVSLFGWGLLKDGDLYENYRHWLSGVINRLGLKGATVGYEKTFEIVGTTYRSSEPVIPAYPWFDLVESLFAASNLVDAADVIQATRAIKGDYEIAKLRAAGEIAEMGMTEFVNKVEPGMTEIDVSAMIEHKIRTAGSGHKGARLIRAWAEVAAGPVGSTRATLVIPSTSYTIREGDLVMAELATVVDGYWSDLTYMAVVGTPNRRQCAVYNKVLEAQQAAAKAVKDGALASAPDEAARDVLEAAGLGEYFVHSTGHGLGYRYHEFIPFLMPGAANKLQAGMVVTVEPGVYIPDFGGIRIEDNVVVGKDGPLFLSTPRKPW
jgi:Xaa-Pro dipeptidase